LFIRRASANADIATFSLIECGTACLRLGVDPLREDQPLEDQWLGDLTQH
jgi:hypothetical protein